jgi:putative ABC transport system ATP-binding protein
MANLIEARALTKVYGAQASAGVRALDGVSLTIEDGEFVGIAGPSGSGKSTLLHILGCLDRPTEGSYWLAGQEVATLGDRELSRIRASMVGFVFQSFNLLQRLSVVENIALPLAYRGVERRERQRRAKDLAERVGLGHRLSHRPAELSGGEAQRVGIARALVASPQVVFADEPTGNLDSKTAQEVLELVVGLHEEGLTVVMVSHDPRIVGRCGRVMHMIDGKMASDSKDTGPWDEPPAAGEAARV